MKTKQNEQVQVRLYEKDSSNRWRTAQLLDGKNTQAYSKNMNF